MNCTILADNRQTEVEYAPQPETPAAPAQPSDGAKFLAALFHPSDLILIRPVESWIDECGQSQSQVIHSEIQYRRLGIRPRDEWVAIPGQAENLIDSLNTMAAREKANLYFGVCPRFGGGGQFDRAWQIPIARALWADVDGSTTPQIAIRRCEEAGLPKPSMVVNSGNGTHLYWLLAEPVVFDDYDGPPAPIQKDWSDEPDPETGKKPPPKQYYVDKHGERIYVDQERPDVSPKVMQFQGILKGISNAIKDGDKSTHDVSRVLRIPGTLNRKNERNGTPPKPCTLFFCDEQLKYSLDQFAHLAIAPTPSAPRQSKSRECSDHQSSCGHTGCTPSLAGGDESLPANDTEIRTRIRMSRDGPKFSDLWAGDTSRYDNNHSRADFHLCKILAFWCRGDAGRIDSMFRQSKLYREKWERQDYRENLTIKKAVASCRGNFYDWSRPAPYDPGFSTARNSLTIPSPYSETVARDTSQLTPGISKPEISQRFSPCRRIKMRMTNIETPARKRIAGFACHQHDCDHCGKMWEQDRIEWYSGIIEQWPEIHQAVIDSGDYRRLYHQMKRKEKACGRDPECLIVRVPMEHGRELILSTYPNSESKPVEVGQAKQALSCAVQEAPKGKHVTASRGIAFKRRKEEPTNKWTRDEHQGPLTQATWEQIAEVLDKSGMECEYKDIYHLERCHIDYTVPQSWTDKDNKRLDELMIPDYYATPGVIVRVAPAERRHLQLCSLPGG